MARPRINYREILQRLQFSGERQGELQAIPYPLVQCLYFIHQQTIHCHSQCQNKLFHGQPTGSQQSVVHIQFDNVLAGVGAGPATGDPRVVAQIIQYLVCYFIALFAAANHFQLYRFPDNWNIGLGLHYQ